MLYFQLPVLSALAVEQNPKWKKTAGIIPHAEAA